MPHYNPAWEAVGADCRLAFIPLRTKLEFMERLAFLEKRTRLLFAQGALLRA
jgi:hypothetical protein